MADTSWAKVVAAVGRRFRRPSPGPAAGFDTTWTTRVDGTRPGLYCRPMTELAGPGVEDLLRYTCALIATSIHEGDTRADVWSDYVIATGNLVAAADAGLDTREPLIEAVTEAWEALRLELPDAVRMSLVDACAVGRLLDRTAGGALHESGRSK